MEQDVDSITYTVLNVGTTFPEEGKCVTVSTA